MITLTFLYDSLLRQWTQNCFPSKPTHSTDEGLKQENPKRTAYSIKFMLQLSRNKWLALRQQEVWQIAAPKTQFAMETTTLSIQNCVHCSTTRLTLSRLPLSPSRPALPVKGQGGGGRSRLRRAAILSTSANFALTTTSLHLYPTRAKNKSYSGPLPVLEWHRKV